MAKPPEPVSTENEMTDAGISGLLACGVPACRQVGARLGELFCPRARSRWAMALVGDRPASGIANGLPEAGVGGADEGRHVAVGVAVLVQELVGEADLVEGEDARQAGVDLAGGDEVVDGLRLLAVGEVGALKALLARPEVAQVDVAVVAAVAGAEDDQ